MSETMTLTYDELVHETSPGEPKSGAVLLNFGNDQHWIPKSVIGNYPEFMDGNEVEVKTWFCEQEGLEDFES